MDDRVYDARKAMGAELAREAPADADVVVPVPDSGVPAAIGYARACGLPFELGIIRNHYVGRTFIQPTQSIRELGVRMKHNANRAVVEGKRIVLIDDSIVRGTTSVKIMQMMREAGAREVHLRISSPPITYPDFYGIDTPERDKLLAARMDLEEMRRFVGADSLAFLSIDGIYRAMGYPGRNPRQPQFTDHCFTGDYPTRLVDQFGDPARQQLSLLAEASLMADASLEELDERIAIVRDNIRELTEQAAALSGAEDETRAADRIADQEQQLRSFSRNASRSSTARARREPEARRERARFARPERY